MPTQPTDKMATELLHVQEELAAKNVDADAPKKQAQRASHRLNFLEAMMETVPVGVVMADAEGKIIYGKQPRRKDGAPPCVAFGRRGRLWRMGIVPR